MKPSERLRAFFDETKRVVTDRVTRTQELKVDDLWELVLEPLARYYDERHELEQRRTATLRVLAILSLEPRSIIGVNEVLAAAGFDIRVEGESWRVEDVRHMVVQTAVGKGWL